MDPKSFTGSLYSPGDGVVDPAMLCTALTRAATKNGGRVIENCPVTGIITGKTSTGGQDVRGVETAMGTIRTNTIVNATGVWGRDLFEKFGVHIPLIPMRHAYVVSETMPGVQGLPNVRDHDFSMYFRIQGQSICMGGYENNPILLDKVPNDFQFGLYDLDWSVFDTHIAGAVELCPEFGKAGVKSTVCGPESFTPDHKPLMGPDPRMDGLFHNCGFNSAGMMLGGGCGEQLALWIMNGRPDLHMFNYDIRRFTNKQNEAVEYATERSHESYAKNYSIVFPYDQPLAGRNFQQDPLHKEMISYGAVMEERQGWERPGYFLKNDEKVEVQAYDWYGNYGHSKNEDTKYAEKLKGEYKFGFSDNYEIIKEEALACRNNAVVFNMSYFCKLFLTGSEAKQAADWIFTADMDKPVNKTIYTCALNSKGGVEADVTVSAIDRPTDPLLKGRGYYIVAGGASANHTLAHIREAIQEKGFKAEVTDFTDKMGVISIQGPKSREILQKITDFCLTNENLPFNTTSIINIKINQKESRNVRVLRVSFVGELGYELHVQNDDCEAVYRSLMEVGSPSGLRNGGYRSLYSLSSEKGYHLWGFDLRADDTPIEANLGFTCRKTGEYKGKSVIDKQRAEGVTKKLAYFTVDEHIPIFGLEAIYRDGEIVGHLRRGEYGYFFEKPIGQGYLRKPCGGPVDNAFIKSGNYQIEIMGKLYDATCHLRSPFDTKHKRVMGDYE